MQLESHATPQRETPQQRYANLHRALERGLESDELWKDLADACLSLGHNDEAIRCLGRMRSDAARLALESRLVRLGICSASAARIAGLPGAAAAKDAEPKERHENSLGAHRLRDHVLDAFQYLFHQHMPWLVILTTLAFPLVVGVGGFLTIGSSLVLLAAMAAVPGLCVLGMVGAMGRQILLTSADGTGDVPPIPGFWQLVRDARRFLVDLVIVLGALLGPALVALKLHAPIGTTVPALLVGGYFVPMAWMMRQVRGDFAALSPVMLLRATARGGAGYLGVAIVTGVLFLPAGAVGVYASNKATWVAIAFVGPLCVLPIYVVSRLLGTWLDVHRAAFAGLIARDRKPATAPQQPKPTGTPNKPKAPTRQPRRPDALQEFKAPVVKRSGVAARPAAPKAPPTPASARPRPPAPAPAQPPSSSNPQSRSPAAPPRQQKAAREIEGRMPSRLTDEPDLAHMPGAVVVSGAERARKGAAAKRP